MRRYESIIIFDPDLSEDQRAPVSERVKEVVTQQGGELAFIDDWGARKLAYEVKKKQRGHYVRFDFCGDSALVDEIERYFRIDDRVLKYMTVLTDDNPDIERIKEEIAQAEIKATQTAAQEDRPEESDAGESQDLKSAESEPQQAAASKEAPVPEASEVESPQSETEKEAK
jgi:small subunit ribosomal protein S6